MTDRRDVMRQIASAGARIDPRLSDRDVERLVAEAERRSQRRAKRRRAAAGAGVAVSLALAGALIVPRIGPLRRADVAPARQSSRPPDVDRSLRLADGSVAVPLDPLTEIAVVGQRPDRVELTLERGRGRFEVSRRPDRLFLVRAGEVTVTVVGTVFTVERVADRVGVTVQRGTVRIAWGVSSAVMKAGQSGWYPPLGAASPDQSRSTAKANPALRSRRIKPVSPGTGPVASGEPAAELLLAADRARVAGHPDQGAELLRKVLRDFPHDRRAPLAAFTLGRLLLMELGRPGEAAAAFAQARNLAPTGPFAEDALAREVEALSKAGRDAEALARAQEYERLFPNGERMATVRAAGGIK